MAFTKSYRLERVYFERLKSMIDILKPYLNEETDEKLKAILENSIDDNGAILLLYRNLGEAWAELSDLIKKADEKIDATKEEAEKYHDELNERIDEVNNYIMGLIRILEETKQDKLIAGDGIGINNENVIRVSNNDIFTNESIGSVLRPYITREVTRNPFRATTKTLYELVDTIVLSATGTQLKELLSKYNALKFNFSFGISINVATNILAVDDIVKISLRRYSFPVQFITFMDRVKLNSIATKTDQGIDVDACSISFAIMNLQNVLHNLVDETVYSFKWEMAYYVEVNGNAITSSDSPYFGYINPENYTPSTVGVRGEF